jgi:Domain of unknown function (DUF6265)
MMLRTVLAAALALTGAPAFAIEAETGQELTRTAEAGAPRPRAELAELDWLQGTWEGEGIEGAMAMEHWSAPVGGAMPGIFVQTDGKGGTMFSEYMQIVPDGESLMVRLKHFNADLTGWEEKDKSVNFPLIGREKGALYFRGLSYLRRGDNRLIVAVRMREADGSHHELVFRFRRKGG